MKNVKIKHNPYTLVTEFEVEGKKVAENSNIYPNLNEKTRFQEWVSEIPQLLRDEYNDTDFDIIFHGTDLDYQDLKFELEKMRDETKNQRNNFNFKLHSIKAKDSNEKLKELEGIFEKLKTLSKKYNFQDLNINSLKENLKKASSEKTEVNVVAIMSAGKSTLINSLLGKKLLTTNTQACTAKIMEIIDNDDDTFTAIGKDSSDVPLKSFSNVTAEDIKEMNKDSNIKKVEVKGNIPFVDSTESSLVLLDSPGTNYTEDPSHKEATLKMIRESPKVLVLFIIDAGNANTNDQKELFQAISESMNSKEDKQLKERFLFVINKIDKLIDDKEENSEFQFQEVINNIVNPLKKFGIENPNIFPVSAEIAFNIRNFNIITEKKRNYTNDRIDFINNDEEFYLEKYSKLPSLNRKKIDNELKEAIENNDIKKQGLIHSGIRNLEEAINVFVTKYSRPAKINALQKALKTSIEDAKSIAKTIEAIPTDEKNLKEYDKKIKILNEQLSSKEVNREFKEKIERLNITEELKSGLDSAKQEIEKRIDSFQESLPEKIDIDKINETLLSFQNIQKTFEKITKELLKKNIEETSQKLLNEYIVKLNKISKEVNIGEIELASYVQSEINLMKFSASQEEILKKKEKKTEYYDDYEWKHRAWYNPMRYIDDEYYQELVTKSREIEFISRKKFDEEILIPVRKELNKVIDEIKKIGEEQTNEIKEEFYKKFDEVDNVLKKIANNLASMTRDLKILEQKIKESKNLKTEIEKIQNNLDKILEI